MGIIFQLYLKLSCDFAIYFHLSLVKMNRLQLNFKYSKYTGVSIDVLREKKC